MVRALDHEVHIERQSGELADRFYHRRSERNIVDEMAVHDVAVNPIGPRRFDRSEFVAQFRKISGEDGRRDDAGIHVVRDRKRLWRFTLSVATSQRLSLEKLFTRFP